MEKQYFHLSNHGLETEYGIKKAFDGSELGTNNENTDLDEMSLNLCHREDSPSFRSRNLVRKR